MNKWSELKDELYDYIVNQRKSYLELGRIYGVSGNAIIKVAKRYGIPLTPRRRINPKETFGKGIYKRERKTCICKNCGREFITYSSSNGFYCSHKCQKEFQHKEKYQLILDGDSSIMRANYSPALFRRDILEEQNNQCAICGMSPEWNGKPLVFIVDHIDGDATNNRRDNLRCICPNCDSQLDTYKFKSKNGARHYYRYRYKGTTEKNTP